MARPTESNEGMGVFYDKDMDRLFIRWRAVPATANYENSDIWTLRSNGNNEIIGVMVEDYKYLINHPQPLPHMSLVQQLRSGLGALKDHFTA